MARRQEGQSWFRGMIGPVVMTSWKGVPVLRTRPSRIRKRKPTPAQEAQRKRFKLASSFLRGFKALIETSFQPVNGKTGMNMAISHLLTQATRQNDSGLGIDYKDVLVAKGSLKKAEEVVVRSTGPGIISFNWADNSGSGNANASDRSILVAYREGIGVMFNTDGAMRSGGQAELVTPFFSGEKIHTWVSFRSDDGELTADSIYTGIVEII